MIEAKLADLRDVELIRKLGVAAFTETYVSILERAQIDYMLHWMYSAESLKRQMAEKHVYRIAYFDGEPCGYVSVQPEGESAYHLQKIYVLKKFQGRKIGEFLFKLALDCIKKEHPAPCRVSLNVNRNNGAVGFYKKMGMKKIAEGDFPIGNGWFMNDYIMAIDI